GGQNRLLGELDRYVPVSPSSAATVEACLDRLEHAPDATRLRKIEADVSRVYWAAWADLPIRFVARDHRRVPRHWLTFGDRSSAITGGPRGATSPGNASLNWCHTLAYSEATLAARIVGL